MCEKAFIIFSRGFLRGISHDNSLRSARMNIEIRAADVPAATIEIKSFGVQTSPLVTVISRDVTARAPSLEFDGQMTS